MSESDNRPASKDDSLCPECGYPWSDHAFGEQGSSVCSPKQSRKDNYKLGDGDGPMKPNEEEKSSEATGRNPDRQPKGPESVSTTVAGGLTSHPEQVSSPAPVSSTQTVERFTQQLRLLRDDIIKHSKDTLWAGDCQTVCERLTELIGDDWGKDGKCEPTGGWPAPTATEAIGQNKPKWAGQKKCCEYHKFFSPWCAAEKAPKVETMAEQSDAMAAAVRYVDELDYIEDQHRRMSGEGFLAGVKWARSRVAPAERKKDG